jgi:hypothetical protein
MRRWAAATAGALAVAAPSVDAGPLAGVRSIKVCAAASAYWPTMTLAVQAGSAWVACKEQSRVIRVDTTTGKTSTSVRLGGPAIAVAAGAGSIWALSSGGTLYRLDPASGKIVRRISLPVAAAYNIWIGGRSVWVADDQGARVLRVSTATNRVVAQIAVGDGPADMAFASGSAWVICHRDRSLVRIDLATNTPHPLANLSGDTPERMVWARGRLWVTGRGTDLLRVNPAHGTVEQTMEIGAGGIDVAVDGDTLVVPARNADVDLRGFPTMQSLRRVSASSGAVSTIVRATGRVDVHGLVVRAGVIWIADNTSGRLYHLP